MSSASERRNSGGGGGESGGGANWMDTYGDLVTLLLTFFVLLFAFSNIDAAKWEALVGSFTGMSVLSMTPLSPEIALENPIQEFGPRSNEEQAEEDKEKEEEDEAQQKAALHRQQELFDLMNTFAATNDINADIVRDKDDFSVRMVFTDLIFFDTADATVRPESIPVLDKVIEMFSLAEKEKLYVMLRVEGHTDKRPIHTAQYPSNWDLSADRALKVISYIRSTGKLDPSKLACIGYGEERPLIDEDTPEAYAKNRRVEFVAETSTMARH